MAQSSKHHTISEDVCHLHPLFIDKADVSAAVELSAELQDRRSERREGSYVATFEVCEDTTGLIYVLAASIECMSPASMAGLTRGYNQRVRFMRRIVVVRRRIVFRMVLCM
jgi:hypothetical protein